MFQAREDFLNTLNNFDFQADTELLSFIDHHNYMSAATSKKITFIRDITGKAYIHISVCLFRSMFPTYLSFKITIII